MTDQVRVKRDVEHSVCGGSGAPLRGSSGEPGDPVQCPVCRRTVTQTAGGLVAVHGRGRGFSVVVRDERNDD